MLRRAHRARLSPRPDGTLMKTILIPTEDHDAMPAVLEAARLGARIFASYINGFQVHPAAATYVAVEPVSSLAISGAYENDAELAAQARSVFETFMQQHGVPRAGPQASGFSYRWRHPGLGAAPPTGRHRPGFAPLAP